MKNQGRGPKVAWSRAEDGGFLLDFESWKYVRLSATATEFWRRLGRGLPAARIAREISEKYSVPRHQALADLLALRKGLESKGLIISRAAQEEESLSFSGTPRIIWRLDKRHPELFCRLLGGRAFGNALGDAYRSLRAAWPVAHTCRPFKTSAAFRLRGHWRSICLPLTKGVICVKGTEPLSPDWGKGLGSLRRSLEHFVQAENKIPLALTRKEALEEAEAAAHFQIAHLARYGELARIPVPLLVCRWPEGASRPFFRGLRSRLSARSRRKVAALAGPGLASYAYFYPSTPVRARHLLEDVRAQGLGRRNSRVLLEGFGAVFNRSFRLDRTIGRWLGLFGRMLALGYLPCGPAPSPGGTCVRGQNAVLDGGFADVDSLIPLSRIKTSAELARALRISIEELTDTISSLL